MNLFRASIDTRHQNAVVANINQFDNAVLELQVLSDGQVSEPWINPRFRLIGIKKDGNEVEQTSNIDIINATDHIIQIKLKEQMTTCRGMVKMQLIITEGDRTSTSIFYLSIAQSLENQVIESHRDVKTLDELEAYIAQGRKVIAEAEEIATNLKNEMSEFNQEAKASESERQANELNRAAKELIRIDNEEDRVANESERVANEEIRVENEEERVANEQDRVVNETNRRIAENTRNAQERARQEAENERNAIFEENENLRKENEKGRIASENDRKKKFATWEERETTRLKSEENRILQEQERNESEEQREQNEAARQQQELNRQQTYNQFNESESSRQANELERQKAEQQRAQAELTRNETFNQSQDDRNRQYAEAEEVRNNAFEQNEANRQEEYTQAERERVESEELRKARERERENAESQRQSAESNRDAAESQRIENFNTAIANANSTMNQAVTNINQAIADSNATMTAIENRADACIPIIEQSADEIEQARTDYTGTTHESLRETNDANVDFILGEVNRLHYEGQQITAHDSLSGQAKNAVVEGMTLVNVMTKIIDATWDLNLTNWTVSATAPSDFILKPSTTYSVIVYVTEKTCSDRDDLFWVGDVDGNKNKVTHDIVRKNVSLGANVFVINTVSDFSNLSSNKGGINFQGSRFVEGTLKWKAIVLEGDWTDKEVPYYFTGMTSVKAPLLRSVGKNLIGLVEKWEKGDISNSDGIFTPNLDKTRIVSNFILNPIKDRLYVRSLGSMWNYIYYYDVNKNYLGYETNQGMGNNYQFTDKYTPTGDEFYVRVSFGNEEAKDKAELYTSIVEGGIYYEPKSNSIITPDDLILQGINDVKDTLDIATGDKIERITEVVMDSDKKITLYSGQIGDNTLAFRFSNLNGDPKWLGAGSKPNLLCSIFPTTTHNSCLGSNFEDREGICLDTKNGESTNAIVIRILKSRLISEDVEGMKDFISKTEFHILSEITSPIVKKLNLSDNRVYSYQDTTHYSFEVPDNSLIPTLSIDVPTNLPAVVTRQNNTITELENENKALKTEIKETSNSSVNGDLELMSQQFDLDFRIFEIETTLDIQTTFNLKGAKNMAMTVFQQAQTLILAGKYDREDMEYKLKRYLDKKRITKTEYDELIAMMDAQELTK